MQTMSTVSENPSKPAQLDPVSAKGDVLVSIQVPLSVNDYAWIEKTAGGRPPTEKLASYVKWFIRRQAGGGLMIEPDDMEYLAKLNEDVRFQTSKDVVRAVEKALKREDGQYSFQIQVDPEYVQPLRDQADFNGTTVELLLSQIGNEVMANGWWQEFIPANGCIAPFDEKSTAATRRILGKFHFTGQDIAEALARLEKLEKLENAKTKTQEKAA